MSIVGPPSASSLSRPSSIAPNDCNVPQAGSDGISSLTWSPKADFLVSGNWGSGIRCWEVQEQGGQVRADPKAQVNHENNSPVLDTCFSADGSTVISGGGDNAVRMWQLGQAPPNNIAQQIGVHDAPVKAVRFLRATNLVVSGGWDRKLKFWDLRSPNPVLALEMPERVYAMDVSDKWLVVATANRHIISYNVSGQPVEHERKQSPLDLQSRCISCFPDSTGFAVGSIEGRVAVEYITKVEGKGSFKFKCHRQGENAYSVNAICFNNNYAGIFATCGSDGVVNFWDKDNKNKLKDFEATQRTISAASFNAQGNLFAYASSYDWSKGSMNVQPGNEIFVHYMNEEEIRPKGKKSSGYKSR